MKGKTVWRLFFLSRVGSPRWHRSAHDYDCAQKSKRAFWLANEEPYFYAAISGTILPDGSVAWPKEWPVP